MFDNRVAAEEFSKLRRDWPVGHPEESGHLKSTVTARLAARRQVMRPAEMEVQRHVEAAPVLLRLPAALLRAKMAEYAGNGAALGWLIVPSGSLVEVYRPGLETEVLRAPAVVSADPELPGFTLQMAEVWEVRW
jgi:Putative restriction endonuclease